jgi:F0F1-type ATP synthase assembly protein I
MAMNKTMRKYVADFKRHKIGLIVGASVGFIAAYYAISQGATLTTIAEAGKGLLDSALGRSASLDLAAYKLYTVFTFIGAAFGYLVDSLLYSRGYKVRGRSKKKGRYLV